MATAAYRADSARHYPTKSTNLTVVRRLDFNRIGAAIVNHDLSMTRFGREAANDPRLLWDIIRHGREPGQRVLAKIDAYIERLDAGEVSRGA